MINQCSIASPIKISGIGLHTGRDIQVTLRPAEAGTGIVFYRHDQNSRVAIKAISSNVISTRMATVLGKEGITVSTVEHLLAALAGTGVDNLHIDIDGPEVPIMDGSAAPFFSAIHRAGIVRLARARKFLSIRTPLTIVEDDKRINIIPSRFFRVSFDISFDHPSISKQHRSIRFSPELFQNELAPARTFGFLREFEQLKASGLALGGSLENAVVLDDRDIINQHGLRFPDEFVRHKILDCIGDFSLLGYPMLGHIRASRTGHDFNHRMVKKILASPDCWKLVEFSEHDLALANSEETCSFAAALSLSKV